jgi:hypothetical protein
MILAARVAKEPGCLGGDAASALSSAFNGMLHGVRGLVLDSGPSEQATPDVWCRGLLSAMLQLPANEVEARHPALVAWGRAVAAGYLAFPSTSKRWGEVSGGPPSVTRQED